MSSTESTPRYTGLRLHGDLDQIVWSMMINYEYKRAMFSVLVSARDHELPPGYKLDRSIEGKILTELSDLSWGDETPEKDKQNEHQDTLVKLAADACLPLMQELLPLAPPPEPTTLQEELYPETYALQVFLKTTSPYLAGLIVLTFLYATLQSPWPSFESLVSKPSHPLSLFYSPPRSRWLLTFKTLSGK